MVSVIIPTYNRASVLEKSIRSVLDQTYGDLELIVIDDGSSDNTKAVVEEINDTRVKYFYQKNMGACAARNAGIKQAKGEYIAFHDSDDIWLPTKLQRQIDIMKNTDADIVFCQMKRCNAEDGIIIIPEIAESSFIDYSKLMVGISTQTLFMKRKVVEHVLFDERMPRFQDLEWLLRAVKQYTLYGMKEVLVNYYFSDDSITMSGRRLLDAVKHISKQYPMLSREAPDVYRVLVMLIVEEGLSKLKQGDEAYTEYLKVGFSFSNKLIDKLKYLAVKCGIYKSIYRIRHFADQKYSKV